MGTSGKRGGQRSNTNSASGQKSRSATSTSHRGSRVEPSHITKQTRAARVKTAARRSGAKAAKQ